MSTKYQGKHAAGLSKTGKFQLTALIVVCCIALIGSALLLIHFLGKDEDPTLQNPEDSVLTPMDPGKPEDDPAPEQKPEETPQQPQEQEKPSLPITPGDPEDPVGDDPGVEDPEDPELPTEPEIIPFEPYFTETTDPALHILTTDVMVGDEIVEDYEAAEEIWFDEPEKYSPLEGVLTFRGDNFRTGSSYGTANLSSKTIGGYWSSPVTSLMAPTATTGPAAAGRVSRSSSNGPRRPARS